MKVFELKNERAQRKFANNKKLLFELRSHKVCDTFNWKKYKSFYIFLILYVFYILNNYFLRLIFELFRPEDSIQLVTNFYLFD